VPRTLRLRREALTDLTISELTSVVGGIPPLTGNETYHCPQTYDCPIVAPTGDCPTNQCATLTYWHCY
jgi:hypothetical protein